jgi:AbrB family looped-hinge helix DNA binding protein
MGKTMGEITVDDKGRILIPKEIRDKLGLQPGSHARLKVEKGRLIITPPLSPEEFIKQMKGCIKKGEPRIDPLKLKEMWEQPQNKQRKR